MNISEISNINLYGLDPYENILIALEKVIGNTEFDTIVFKNNEEGDIIELIVDDLTLTIKLSGRNIELSNIVDSITKGIKYNITENENRVFYAEIYTKEQLSFTDREKSILDKFLSISSRASGYILLFKKLGMSCSSTNTLVFEKSIIEEEQISFDF